MKSKHPLILVLILFLSAPAVAQEPAETDAFRVINSNKTITVFDPFVFKVQMHELNNRDSVEMIRQQMDTLMARKEMIRDTLFGLRSDTVTLWRLNWFDYYYFSGHVTKSFALIINHCYQSSDTTVLLTGSEIVRTVYPDSMSMPWKQNGSLLESVDSEGHWYFYRSGDYLIMEWIWNTALKEALGLLKEGYQRRGHYRYFFRLE